MPETKTRILFVDDDAHGLAALRRRLHGRSPWEVAFVQSGAEALALMAKQPFDVIATDLHMPVMSGEALLTQVRIRWPAMYRIILSGTLVDAALVRHVRDAHHFLGKPFELETLQGVLDGAMRNRRGIVDPTLAGFASGIRHLPSLPGIYQRISDGLADDSKSVREIGDLIAEDVAMTAKILRLVNSGFFGLPKLVGTPGEAAVMLGLELVRSLVLGTAMYTNVDPQLSRDGGLHELWQHSLDVSRATRVIARTLKCYKSTADAAFQAAILHEVGRLVFLLNKPEEYIACRQEMLVSQETAQAVEVRHLGATHEKLGAYLLGTWGLPDHVVQAVALHRQPSLASGRAIDALCLVHLADNLSTVVNGYSSGLDTDYLSALGLTESLPDLAAAVASELEPSSR